MSWLLAKTQFQENKIGWKKSFLSGFAEGESGCALPWISYPAINFLEENLRKKGKEVNTIFIGQIVSNALKKIDKVAYIRFASVYRDFTDIADFKKEIKELVKK